MKKFGFSKKDKGDKGGGSDSGPGKASPASASSNPYSQINNDPYAPSPPAYDGGGGRDSFRDNKSPAYTQGAGAGAGSGAPPGGRYGPQPTPSGYGSSRYGAGGGEEAGGSRYGSNGYGGFGGGGGGVGGGAPPQQSAAPSRYGGGPAAPGPDPAPSRYGASGAGGYGTPAGGRYGQQSAMQVGAEQDARSQWESGTGPSYGQAGADSQGYGSYQDRQLTAEEQEEEDVLAAKNEIKFLKQSDVSSTRNALRIAAMAEETGRSTLERLGAQGERIHNTERNLDLASNQNRLAAEKAREISTLNRSMFAVHVSNPFTSNKRIKEREEQVLRDAREDRERRDATRNAAWSTQARAEAVGRDLKGAGAKAPMKGSLAERSKYQFEADSEDEAMEEEIDGNISALHGAAGRLNHLARAMGNEVDSQNKHIERIGGKVDKVDDEIALNRNRLDRIH